MSHEKFLTNQHWWTRLRSLTTPRQGGVPRQGVGWSCPALADEIQGASGNEGPQSDWEPGGARNNTSQRTRRWCADNPFVRPGWSGCVRLRPLRAPGQAGAGQIWSWCVLSVGATARFMIDGLLATDQSSNRRCTSNFRVARHSPVTVDLETPYLEQPWIEQQAPGHGRNPAMLCIAIDHTVDSAPVSA